MISRARVFGHILLWIGFLAGAFTAVRSMENKSDPWATIDWRRFVGAVALGAGGVALLRATHRKGTLHAAEQRSVEELEQLVTQVSRTVEAWLDAWSPNDVYTIHTRIDEQLANVLLEFATHRHVMEEAWGLSAYAAVMDEFAQGERLLNRAWSASADGYADEVLRALQRSRSHFAAAAAEMARRRSDHASHLSQIA